MGGHVWLAGAHASFELNCAGRVVFLPILCLSGALVLAGLASGVGDFEMRRPPELEASCSVIALWMLRF